MAEVVGGEVASQTGRETGLADEDSSDAGKTSSLRRACLARILAEGAGRSSEESA